MKNRNGEQISKTLNTAYRIMRLSFQVAPGLISFVLVNRILMAAVPVSQVLLMKWLVDDAVRLFAGEDVVRNVYILLVSQFAILILSQYLQRLDRLTLRKLQVQMKYNLEDSITTKSTLLPLHYFESSQYYDQLQRAASAQNNFHLVGSIFTIVQNVMTLASYAILMIKYNAFLLIGLIILVIPSLLVNLKVGKKRFSLLFYQTPFIRRMEYLFQLLIGREAAKEIRLLKLSDYLKRDWREQFHKNAEEVITMEKKAGNAVFAVDSSAVAVQMTVTGFLLWLGYLGRLTIGGYVSMAQAFASAQTALQQISFNIAAIYENTLFAQQYFEFIDMPIIQNNKEESSYSPFPAVLSRGIKLNKVNFVYPGQKKQVLNDVSFIIAAGKKVAIVGENGSGKSTLVKCLLGLYPDYEGSIFYDDLELRNIDVDSFRNHVSSLFQDFVRYQSTVRENIGFGQVEQIMNEGLLQTAAAKAGINEMIDTLPEGIDSQVGPMFLGGRDLSGGQWQRIALARAFIRHAQILVLDEPTAAVDPITEAEIYSGLRALSNEKTTIMVTHRLSICESFDEILVMKDGHLIEQGSHRQLLRQGGEYAKMYDAQNMNDI